MLDRRSICGNKHIRISDNTGTLCVVDNAIRHDRIALQIVKNLQIVFLFLLRILFHFLYSSARIRNRPCSNQRQRRNVICALVRKGIDDALDLFLVCAFFH